jgi:glutaredoxin/glutathione-dependent peroxiredoxin
VARYGPEFAKRSVKTIGLSCNDKTSHEGWIKDINEVNGVTVEFPIIADPERKVARLYGMLGYQDDTPKDAQPKMPLTVRLVFIIDPSKAIRAMLAYPASAGTCCG